jgi:hypothetical protein
MYVHSNSGGERTCCAFRDATSRVALCTQVLSCLFSLSSTTSLRGLMMGTLRVDVLTEAVHSGMASGIVPSSFRIIRQLLDRIENAETGKLPAVCYAPDGISAQDLSSAKATGETVGAAIHQKFPW